MRGRSRAERPQIGKVEIFKTSDLRPGMQGTAWTVFSGTTPEPIPVEILGLWKNAWGPRQDVILAKLGGKAVRTNVAGGMSGSPVYIDGKLVGAVALRLSVFSPDAICGITPVELMLEIKDFDQSRPADARTPDKAVARSQAAVPGDLLAQAVAAGASPNLPRQAPMMVPIETPLMFSGFQRERVCAISARCSSSWASRRCRAAARPAPPTRPSPRPAGRIRCVPAIRSPACWCPAI